MTGNFHDRSRFCFTLNTIGFDNSRAAMANRGTHSVFEIDVFLLLEFITI